jgi:hypothetical protein
MTIGYINCVSKADPGYIEPALEVPVAPLSRTYRQIGRVAQRVLEPGSSQGVPENVLWYWQNAAFVQESALNLTKYTVFAEPF